MKTEAEMFADADALVGNTMIVFSDRMIAARYMQHRATTHFLNGVLPLAVDSRTNSGICVLWRDPVPPEEFDERIGNCLWLLEETLAGRSPWPEPGETTVLSNAGDIRRN